LHILQEGQTRPERMLDATWTSRKKTKKRPKNNKKLQEHTTALVKRKKKYNEDSDFVQQ